MRRFLPGLRGDDGVSHRYFKCEPNHGIMTGVRLPILLVMMPPRALAFLLVYERTANVGGVKLLSANPLVRGLY